MKDITDMEKDRQYMKMALELAQKGMGFTAPNPMVGAVIVKRGKVIGQGYHRKYGEPHAEREALASCTEQPEGASIYVTLEPCCHYGKQPPCVNAILESGIRRVIIGSSDPNPLVSGKGIRILKEHGKRVENSLRAVGMLERRKDSPNKLSGGQKQRVAIAGVIAMEPKCIVLDEPTAMLDPVGRKEVLKTVKKLREQKKVVERIFGEDVFDCVQGQKEGIAARDF